MLSDRQILDKLQNVIEGHGVMAMSIKYEPSERTPGMAWSILTVFGQEAMDSPMAAGSHIGSGRSLRDAFTEAFDI